MWCWYRQVTLTANAVYFRWGARGESGLRNFERLPSQVSHISKYETDLRIDPKNIIIKKEK